MLNGSLDLNNLTTTESLVLPYDFNIFYLICNEEIKEEILKNPDLYFRKPGEKMGRLDNISRKR